MKLKRFLCLILSLVMALSLCGCSNWDETGQFDALSEYYQDQNQEEVPELTTFSLPYYAAQTWDPITCSDGLQLTLSGLLYESLYYLDETFEPQPLLAASYRYDTTSHVYTIVLRSDAVFSDGSAVTPKDVEKSLDRARDSQRYGARFSDVVWVISEDDAITIKLDEDNRCFLSLLDIPIVKYGTEGKIVPTGSGPYIFSQESSGEYLVLNENWWQKKSLPLERIPLQSYKNMESASYAFAARDVQLLFSDLTATGSSVSLGSGDVTDAHTTTLHYIGFNCWSELMARRDMRRALSLAVDRQGLIDSYLLGHADATQFPISPASLLYPKSMEQTVSPDIFTRAMAEQGYNTGEKTIYATMIVNEESSFKVSMAEAIAAAMSTCDLQVNVVALPWEQFEAALLDGKYDMYYGEVRLTADWNISSMVTAGSEMNFGGFEDPAISTALTNYLTSSAGDRENTCHQLCEAFQELMPFVPICFTSRTLLVSAGAVENVTPTMANPFYRLEDWVLHINE